MPFDARGTWYEDQPTQIPFQRPYLPTDWGQAGQQHQAELAWQRYSTQQLEEAAPPKKKQRGIDLIADTEGLRVANTFLLGCDPEAVVVSTAGLQINVLEEGVPIDGEVGADHGGRVLEFRPAPAYSAYTLVKRLQASVKAPVLEKIRAHKWRGGAFFSRTAVPVVAQPDEDPGPPMRVGQTRPLRGARMRGDGLGGHIHLDIKRDYYHEYDDMVMALNRITKYCEHLDILPQAECLARRRNTEYGRWGDFRDDAGRMEYRTMASWMFSPITALVCLTAAKCAVLDPEITVDSLPTKLKSFEKFRDFLEGFKTKDADAARVCEKLLPLGVKGMQKDPEVDIKESWERLPI